MQKKVALITGASHGIGRAIALEFAKAGYRLAINCRTSREELAQLKEEIEGMGTECRMYVGDVGEDAFVGQMFADLEQHFSTVDVLVNNAGISYVGLLTDMTAKEWHRVIETNLSSLFYCSTRAIPMMLKKKSGRIINISSMWGTSGASCEVAYSASKGGMDAFTKALAKELAPSKIAVNAIACGVIDTRMNQCFTEDERAALAEEIPAGRFGRPEEVAALALQLAEGSDYLTGQVIRLDGGFL